MEPSNDLIWLLLNHAYSIQIYPLNQKGMDCIFQVPYLRWIKFHYLLDCASTSFGHPRIESLALQVATRFCLPRALKDLRALRQLPIVSGCARNHPNLTGVSCRHVRSCFRENLESRRTAWLHSIKTYQNRFPHVDSLCSHGLSTWSISLTQQKTQKIDAARTDALKLPSPCLNEGERNCVINHQISWNSETFFKLFVFHVGFGIKNQYISTPNSSIACKCREISWNATHLKAVPVFNHWPFKLRKTPWPLLFTAGKVQEQSQGMALQWMVAKSTSWYVVLLCFIPNFNKFHRLSTIQGGAGFSSIHSNYQAFWLNYVEFWIQFAPHSIVIKTEDLHVWCDVWSDVWTMHNAAIYGILSLHRFDTIRHYMTPHRHMHSMSECLFLQQCVYIYI